MITLLLNFAGLILGIVMFGWRFIIPAVFCLVTVKWRGNEI